MKYRVIVKVENLNNEFNTEVEARNEWHSTTMAMANFLKTNKLSGELVRYKVIDESGNILINQLKGEV